MHLEAATLSLMARWPSWSSHRSVFRGALNDAYPALSVVRFEEFVRICLHNQA